MHARGLRELVILHEDADCLVIDKPAGLAVHPGQATPDSLETRLAAAGSAWRPVHRLDRDTSGCLLLAKRPAALRRLQRAFAAREVAKTYLAAVAPPPQTPHGRIDAPLAKRSTRMRGWRMVVAEDGQTAMTRWEAVARRPGVALVRFLPETGRTHQLRVHATLLAPGAAILGDPVYGRGETGGLMLHAARIGFTDSAGRLLDVRSPLPARFRRLGFDGD